MAETATVRNQATTRGCSTVLYQPYVTGPRFVDQVRSDGGGTPSTPSTTTSPTAPSRCSTREDPDEEPVNVSVADRSSDEWSRFTPDLPKTRSGKRRSPRKYPQRRGGRPLRYESEISAGWGGDLVVPYRNSPVDDGDVGRLAGILRKTPASSTAYRAALTRNTTPASPENVYVVPEESQFNDAFRVVRSGKTVRIVTARQ